MREGRGDGGGACRQQGMPEGAASALGHWAGQKGRTGAAQAQGKGKGQGGATARPPAIDTLENEGTDKAPKQR